MRRCPSCRRTVREPREGTGARCPHCREPLYERPRVPERVADEPDAGHARCAVHPGNVAVCTCERCGNFLCSVCWTRWRRLAVCTACVERALETSEKAPEEVRAHFRQAILALVFGVVAWLVTALPFVLLAASGFHEGIQVVAGLAIIASLFVGVLGIGQGAAAIRARGDHMILATCGLLLSALQSGVVLGMFILALWNS